MDHLALIPLVKAIGYPGIALAVFLESGIPVGFFLPGASMLFAAGLLASKGLFDPWALIGLITLAAILGDSAGYWLGRHLGIRLFLRPDSRWLHHRHLERAKVFYDQYGNRAIFFGRFIPIVRTFAPIVAGVVSMRYRTFLTYNIFGALAWAAGTAFLGYWLGAKVPFINHFITPIILVIIVLTMLPVFWDVVKKRRAGEITGLV